MSYQFNLDLKFGPNFPPELKAKILRKAQENLDARPADSEDEVYQRVLAIIGEYFPDVNARRYKKSEFE